MGQEQILQKLSNKLQRVPVSEEDFVYILSKIRKKLETDNHPEKYAILNFYCNLALHTKIDKPPKVISDKLKDMQKDTDLSADYSMVYFGDFHEQLKDFLIENNLPNFYDKTPKISDLNKLLYDLYSDTPIITEVVTKYKTTFRKDGTIDGFLIDE